MDTFNGGESTTAASVNVSLGKSKNNNTSPLNKATEIVECRVCQEEDQVLSMEAPCACNGTLKVFSFLGFSHHKNSTFNYYLL